MYMVVLNQTGTFTPTGWQTSQEKACLTAVLEHTATGVIEVNQLTQIVGINTAALRLFGYTKQELMGRKIQALIPERLRYQYTGSSAATNLCGLKKSGEEFPVEISLTNYTFDHQPFIIVFVTDISARKKKRTAGNQAERSAGRYRRAAHQRIKIGCFATSAVKRGTIQIAAKGKRIK